MPMFRTRFKREILTEFLPPARATKKQRVIVLCDGMPSIPRKQSLSEFLAAKGYWVFYPRYRGSWESGGEFLARSPHEDILAHAPPWPHESAPSHLNAVSSATSSAMDPPAVETAQPYFPAKCWQ